MAVIEPSMMNGHIQSQLTRSLERILEEAQASGELRLNGRKLKEFPRDNFKYNLADTVVADLSKNRFSELPIEVTTFNFLEKLQAYNNVLRSIPDAVAGLHSLTYLDLSNNQLVTLPREICQLPLEILLVSNNRLISLPDELSRMANLAELDASHNQLTHLPPHLGDLPELKSLILRSNQLLCVPVEVTLLKLIRLDLRENRISALPVEMVNMLELEYLLLDDNPLNTPPAALCKRGRVHIFKYLEAEMSKRERIAPAAAATVGDDAKKGRRSTPSSCAPSPQFHDRFRHRRHNIDSGYSTSDGGLDKRWSQELQAMSTPSTVSPGDLTLEEEIFRTHSRKYDELRSLRDNAKISPNSDGAINGNPEDKSKPLQQIQTYREYKEALKQQRQQEVAAIYRSRDSDESSNKTEPSTPTHSMISHHTLATSKSDPTPLNSVLGSPKQIFDDTSSPKRPVQKVQPSRCIKTTTAPSASPTHLNGSNGCYETSTSKYILTDYVKPSSPSNSKPNSPRSSANHVNGANSNGVPRQLANGVGKAGRAAGWSKEGHSVDKLSFTMKREFDKAREELDLIDQLRNTIETRLKMSLPQDLAPALTDGVVLCHLANHVRPRSVASIHVPSPSVPKLTMARCRKNVDNFLEACRKIGVEEALVCSNIDITEGLKWGGMERLCGTVQALLTFANERPARREKRKDDHDLDDDVDDDVDDGASPLPQSSSPNLDDTTVSIILLSIFVAALALLIAYPPPD